MELDSKIPPGPLAQKWAHAKSHYKLVNPANKRKYDIIVVGAGLAGASAAATLGELGYNVKCFVFHDSPRRAHSIAAQGGINAAKNYQNDGDSIYRLFYDTIKGGDYRSREANVYRLAELSVEHHRPGRRAGRAVRARVRRHCSRIARSAACRSRARSTRAARPASSCSSARSRRWSGRSRSARVKMYTRYEMLDLVVVDGHAKGIITRNLVTGADRGARRRRGRPRHRRLRQRLLSLDEREGLERHGHLARAQARRGVRESLLHADPSDLHPADAATSSRS